MKNLLDSLQQAWQAQQCATPAMNPDQLLKGVRIQRRVNLRVDIMVILVFLCVGALMLWSAFRDIQKDWPWLISAASNAWVVGYILFDQWRRRRDAAHYDETLLAHVEWSIKELEHQKWLSRNTLWWYLLPIALACMIPPVFFSSQWITAKLLSCASISTWFAVYSRRFRRHFYLRLPGHEIRGEYRK